MVPLRIKGFFLDHDKMPVAVLSDPAGLRTLPVWVGPAEASAIITELEDIRNPRPVAHDILAQYFQRHGFVMDCLEIYADAGEQGYYSRIRYHHRWRRYQMEVRPSDGLALAVRLKAPILAARSLLSTTDFPTLLAFLHDPARGSPLPWLPGPEAGSVGDTCEHPLPLN